MFKNLAEIPAFISDNRYSMRYFKRAKLELDAVVKPLSANDLTGDKKLVTEGVVGKTKNISASGAMIELTEELGPNSYVMVHIYLDKNDFPTAIPGQTVWSKPHNNVKQTGIRFLTRDEVADMTGQQAGPDEAPGRMGFTEKEQEALDRLLDDILNMPEDTAEI